MQGPVATTSSGPSCSFRSESRRIRPEPTSAALSPATRPCTCSAASSISLTRRMSRCIERSRFFENGLDEHRVQGDASHQTVGEELDLPSPNTGRSA